MQLQNADHAAERVQTVRRLPAFDPRIRTLLLVLVCLGLFALSRYAPSPALASQQSTIPQPPGSLIEIRGPISVVSATEWEVAGVPVQITDATRLDERIGQPDVGMWARVQGTATNPPGGLIALRIKITSPKHFVRVRGPLDTLDASKVVVGGISLARTSTTKIVGNPVAGDRVDVKAAIQDNGKLLALDVVKKGFAEPEEEPDEDGGTKLTGIVQPCEPVAAAAEPILVSGIPVAITDQTKIDEKAGPLLKCASVKVRGHVEAGTLIAEKIQTIASRKLHKLEGTLDSIGVAAVVVDGLSIALDDATKVAVGLKPGQRVEVKAELQADGTLLAVEIEREDEAHGHGEHDRGQVVHFTAEIEDLPDSHLSKPWMIGGRTVAVDNGTEIEDHKGEVKLGAKTKVVALVGAGGELTALEIVVIRDPK